VPSRDESIKLWNQVIATRKARRIPEVRAAHDAAKDDSVWDWTLAPIIEEGSDTIEYMLITAVEVTHQVRIREEAERLGRLKDEFLSIASHELRVPMTPLMGFADLLARTVGQYQTNAGTDNTPRVNQMVDAIQQQIGRLNRIIEDLLDVARLQNGKFSLEREQVNLGTLLAQIVAEARVIAPDQPIELHLPSNGAPVEVVGDAQRLSQIMMNLIQNAIRHASDSPQINVRLSTVHDATSRAQFAQIDVQDNGPGIAPEALPAIFDRFYQLEHADQPLRNGLGLGLFICKQLVEQHGGTISVQSTVGQGSTFTIRLPLAQT
jgi:signal transduction histidine kinase